MCGVCESAAAVRRSAAELTAACFALADPKFRDNGPLGPELNLAFAAALPLPKDMRRTVARIKRRSAR